MLDTSGALGPIELPRAAAAGGCGSPVDSEGTEFFDAHEAMPWTPERPARQSPAAIAARRMQLALWPETEPAGARAGAEGTQEEDVANGVGISIKRASSAPSSALLGKVQDRTSSLRSLFPSKASTMPLPRDWKVIHSRDEFAIVTHQTLLSGGGGGGGIGDKLSSAVESMLSSSGGGAYTDRSGARRAANAEPSTPSYGRSDSRENGGDESSTVSGTTVTEEGWDSGHGSTLDGHGGEADGPGSREDVADGKGHGDAGGAVAGATAAASAGPPGRRSSLRHRVLDGARTLHHTRERRLKKMMSMGRRKRPHTAAASAAAATAATAVEASTAAPAQSSTSPDGLSPASDVIAALHSRKEAAGGKEAKGTGAAVAGQHAEKDDTAAEAAPSLKGGRKTCRYKLRRGGGAKGRGKGDKGGDRPPEMNLKQHGRGGGKDKGWRSMHMVQCLRYHEGPVWTLKFNARGTRIATGGQDGKVVVWNLAAGSSTETDEVVDDGGDSSPGGGASSGGVPPASSGRRGTGGVSPQGGSVDDASPDGVDHTQGEGEEGAPEASYAAAGDYGGDGGEESSSEGVRSRGESIRRSEESASFGSTVVSEDEQASTEHGSSELGLVGGRGQKGKSFSAVEVFSTTPVRVFEGHKSDVVDLSWSHSDFLCSASIDHTVMLWHPVREECLGTFTHPDFVTSVHFHPLDDQFFLTGCFDKRLRLWKIPDGRVVDWVQCQDLVSAASFSPDGQLAAAGLYNGRVMFYHTTGLRYYTQIHCRNRHGSKRRGKKVTGLDFVETSRLHHGGMQQRHQGGMDFCSLGAVDKAGGMGCPGVAEESAMLAGAVGGACAVEDQQQQQHSRGGKADSMSAQYSLLTTTNDSRLRIYDLDHFGMTCKFKGLVNDGIQIKASFSEDGMFVISGSEDGQVYLWNSKQCRKRSRRGGSPSCPLRGADAASGAAAAAAAATAAAAAATAAAGAAAAIGGTSAPPPLCPISSAAAAAAAAPAPGAPTPATRIKSRVSSSFSVQCATTPHVATAAVFFPSASLDAVCRAAAGSLVGAGVLPPTEAALEGRGKRWGGCQAKSGRGRLYRTPSLPVTTGGEQSRGEFGNGDGGGGDDTSRRRWSFAGQARFGSGAVGGLGRPKTLPQARAAPGAGIGKVSESSLGEWQRRRQHENAGLWTNNDGSPSAESATTSEVSTTRPSIDSPGEEGSTRDAKAAPGNSSAAAMDATGVTAAQHVSEWERGVGGRFGRGEGMVKAIVSADFNGDIKVFFGVVGSSESYG
ncbi:unnamed protein product [Scytosiphon promiscuus]